jgi:hypothetical protein
VVNVIAYNKANINPQPSQRTAYHYDAATGVMEWDEVRWDDGVIEQRHLTTTSWSMVQRTNCWCCSCAHQEGDDPSCRNHGWWGRRPCELHAMAGETSRQDVIPDSVEVCLRKRNAHATGGA